MKRRLEEKGAPPERIARDPELGRHDGASRRSRATTSGRGANGLVERFVVMHSGNVGHAQDLDTLVRAGDVPARPRRPADRDRRLRRPARGLVALAERLEADKVVVPRPTSRASCSPSRCRAADIHFVGLARGLSGYVVPSRAVRDPRRGPARDRRRRRRERDGAARRRGRLRDRRAARATRARSRRRSATRTTASTTSRRWAATGASTSRPRPTARSPSVATGRCIGELAGPPRGSTARCRRREDALLGLARRARLDARRLSARGRRRGARSGRGRCAKDDSYEPTVTVIVAAYNEEAVIERRLENLLALDYPAREARDRRRLGRVHRPDATSSSRPSPRGSHACASSNARAAARSPRRTAPCARPRARSSRSRTRTRPGRPTRCGGSSRTSPTPTSPTSAGGCGSRRADGSNQEGVYWRYELVAARRRSRALGSVTGGNGSIYAVRRERLRRGRSALRSRPLAPVPDGPARAARGLRAGRGRVREADADERDRVPAQGAHVRALLADRAARVDAPPPAARCTSPRSSRTVLLRYGSGVLHLVLLGDERRARSPTGWPYQRRRSPLRSALLAAARRGPADRPLLRARHVGDRAGALRTTSGAACPRPGTRRRATR